MRIKPSSRYHGQYIPSTDGTRIYAEFVGDPAQQSIVFIHGGASSHLCWQEQFESDLATQFHLVRLDLRGHGASDKPTAIETYTGRYWADDIHAVLTALHLNRPVLCGWSFGGVVICDYLRYYGERSIGGIIFVDAITELGNVAMASMVNPSIMGRVGQFLLATSVTERLEALEHVVDDLLLNAPVEPEEYFLLFGYNAFLPPIVGQALLNHEPFDSATILDQITLPCLVLQGQEDAGVLPAYADFIARHAKASKISYPCGHAPFYQLAEQFNQDVAAFLRQRATNVAYLPEDR